MASDAAYYIILLSCIYQFSVGEHCESPADSVDSPLWDILTLSACTHGDQRSFIPSFAQRSLFVCIMKLDGFACVAALSVNQQWAHHPRAVWLVCLPIDLWHNRRDRREIDSFSCALSFSLFSLPFLEAAWRRNGNDILWIEAKWKRSR